MLVLGLPDWFKSKPPEDQPVAVQLVNISEFTRALKRNPHPVEQAKLDTPVPNTPSQAPAQQKPDLLAPPPPPPAAARNPDQDTDDSTPPPEKQKPAPDDNTPPPAPPKPTPAPPPPKPKPTPPKTPAKAKAKPDKPVKPKPVKKKAPKARTDLDADSLLANLADQAAPLEKSNAPPRHVYRAPPPQVASAQPDAPLGEQLSTSEIDAVRAQIEKCWYWQGGGKNEDQIVVPIKLTINQDGTVASAQIVDNGSYNTNPLWQAVADSAVRAVQQPACTPLKLPADKFDNWQSTTINFSPQDLQ